MIGTIAALLTSVSFVPQVIQVYKTKETSSISLIMYTMFVTGVFCWIIHGMIMKDSALLYANVFTFVFASYILFIKVKNVIRKKDALR